MAVLEAIARFALKNAITGVVWLINDGLRDVLASFTYVDPAVKVWVDIAAVVLDVIALGVSAVSTLNLVKSFSVVNKLSDGLKYLATKAQGYIEKKAIGPLATQRFGTLGNHIWK
ncbi:hypothetical protein [Dictyobacter kobayashii]|uniref:Uncharacterized protein n=1 Tax=Dictyobacter kobayashii TaxID=2014872 RepID=A0A402AVP3_9CHLR|nr:hypothetical protein [Dictyobacter kobayashii]GCE23135.1 hypothetical protein KDK_69350 [Dictyobacter kobayashii]